MFDPQMLMNMFGASGGMGNLFSGGVQNNDDNQNNQMNSLMNMFGGGGGNMLTGLMQIMNSNNNNSNNPPIGKNTYVNKVSSNNNVNLELYHIIKNSENIL